MGSARKSRTVRSAEDDLMQVTPPDQREEGRCVPMATGAMALPVCKGDQHKAEGEEYRAGTEGAPPGKDSIRSKKRKTSGDESLNDQ